MRRIHRAFLLIDNTRNRLTRYMDGVAVERYNITDRRQFDRSFRLADAERVRQGTYSLRRVRVTL